EAVMALIGDELEGRWRPARLVVNGARKLTPFRRLKIDPLLGMGCCWLLPVVVVFGLLSRSLGGGRRFGREVDRRWLGMGSASWVWFGGGCCVGRPGCWC